MRQAVWIEGSQLVTEIRRECRQRDKLVQAECGWKRCLHNRYLLDIIVDWNVTPCSLKDGTKSCHITQNIIHYHLHEKSHFIYLFSGIIRSMVPSQTRQKPATVFRSETEYRSWSIDKLLAKIYRRYLKENMQNSWQVIRPSEQPEYEAVGFR
jgi:hypothetical protein